MPLYPNLDQIKKEVSESKLKSNNFPENMSISFEHVKDMITKFDGTKSKLFEFVDNCDKANKIIKPEQKNLLFTLIETKLTDNARSVVRNREFRDWIDLKKFLLDTYSEKRTSCQWQLELNSCRQGFNESVLSYSNRVENCYLKLTNTLNPTLTAEKREACIELLREQALNVFITGLQKDLLILVKSQKPDSLELAIAIALSEEQEIKSKAEINRYQNVNSGFAKHCTFCNKPGHSNFNCRYNKNSNQNNVRHFQKTSQNQNFSNQSQFKNTPNLSHNFNTNANNQSRSFYSKFCNYCKRKGHLINECRTREYNNNRKKQNHDSNNSLNTRNTQTLSHIQNLNLNDQGLSGSGRSEKCPHGQGRISIINSAVTTYLKINSLQLFDNPNSFLLDTGADVSLIKLKYLKDETPCFENYRITLKGIDHNISNPIKTICYVYLDIEINNHLINHCFHVVPDNFPIPFDGLIGNDFIKQFQCHINYEDNLLQFQNFETPLYHLESPVNTLNTYDNNPIPKCSLNQTPSEPQNPHANDIILSPRSETVIKIKIINSHLNEGICPDIHILDDVVICPSIVKVIDNNYALTTVLNSSEKSVKISQLDVMLEPLPTNRVQSVSVNHISRNSEQNSLSDRLQKITSLLRIDHLNKEEKSSLLEICHDFSDIFYVEGDQLTFTDAVMHEIHTNSSLPINTKSYRYPEVHKEEVNQQINKMLTDGIIEPSNSPWNSPVWIVPKKLDASGKRKWRIVIDYRKLNEITIGDSFPLPNISDILDQLGHSKYFSIIDLTSGFHQIRMSSEDAPKTAFSTPSGHYQFQRMPFGLRNAPATFQRLMNTVLMGIQNIRCFVYLDDIVVFADNLENHNKRLVEVFERLSRFNLKIQPDKCEFMRREVMYLGHLITEQGVKPDPAKVKAVSQYPVPTCPKDIKAFLGLAGYYRRFIKNFSSLSKPLTSLLKKDVNFVWSSKQQDSFEKLKSALCLEPVLQYPDFTKTFYLTTDASNFAIGSVLSQGQPPSDLPIAYASRTLNRAEGNYSTTEKELLAIVWSVKHFRPYLYGRKFVIMTDHKPLTWLFNVKDPGSRLVRWRLTLEEYDYDIIYKPGKINHNADALSRISIPEISPESNCKEIACSSPFLSANINHVIYNSFPTYSEFLKLIKNTVIVNNNLEDTGENLIDSNNDIIIFLSKDLEQVDDNLRSIFEKYSHLECLRREVIEVGNIKLFEENKRKIFYVFYKNNYWDTTQYADIYNILIKLQNLIVSNNTQTISIPVFGINYDKLKWNQLRIMIRFIFKGTNINIKIHHNTLVKPNSEQIKEILIEYHSNPISGHSGFHRTYNRIKSKFKWQNMKNDIKKFIKSCDSCQKNKLVRKKHKQPMEITTTSSNPFEKIFLDIVGPLTQTQNNNRYILTLQDDLTKFSRAFAIPNHESQTIARHFIEKFICIFGIPQIIVTDQGKDFTSDLLKQISKLLKIKQINCTAYHPQSNGALERSHATLADYLKHYINDNQTDWDDWLDFSMFSYNTTTHTSTKFSPFELVFGNKANLPTSITKTPEFKYTYDDYFDELTLKLQKSQEIARNNLLHSKEVNKKYYDKKINNINFKVGQKVYLLNEQIKPRQSKKLTQNYNGPYQIVEINSPVNYTILIKNKQVKVHANRLKPAFVSD